MLYQFVFVFVDFLRIDCVLSLMVYLFFVWPNNAYFVVLLKHFISSAVILYFSCAFSGQVSPSYSRADTTTALYNRNLIRFQTLEGY
jgi:hypothetical protein